MKKTLSVAIAATLAAFVTTSCKKDEAKSDTKTDDTAKVETKATAAKAETKPAAKPDTKTDEPKIGSMTVEELAKTIETAAVLDANGDAFRKEHGKIPGATLLTSYSEFKVDELPKEKDKKLVFYCSNTQCGASKAAAGKAMAAGYGDVNVLPVGLLGWKEAGQKTEAVQ